MKSPHPPLDLFLVFARVAEVGGFTAAAQDLEVSKATVSKAVAELEHRLGVSLLRRTTRRLSLTEAGERVLARARRIAQEAEGAMDEASEHRGEARGRLRISVPMTWGLRYLSPVLPDFMAQHPGIQVDLSLEDRAVDLIAEGFDLVVRIREMTDSTLVVRQLANVHRWLVAAPAYLQRMGTPQQPEDLSDHACLHYSNLSSGAVWQLVGGGDDQRRSVRVTGPLCANNGDAIGLAARAGLGIALQPDFIVCDDLRSGAVVRVLPEWQGPPLRMHVLTAPGGQMPRKVRVFSDFLHTRFGALRTSQG